MKFRYVGESPEGPFQMYGHTWEAGAVNDVSDEWAVGKLKGNAFFEDAEAASVEAPRRGRARRVEVEAENGDDQN